MGEVKRRQALILEERRGSNIRGEVAGASLVEFSRTEEMAAFDRLPPLIRRMINDYPIKLSGVMALREVNAKGEIATARLLRDKRPSIVATLRETLQCRMS